MESDGERERNREREIEKEEERGNSGGRELPCKDPPHGSRGHRQD